MLTCLKQWYLIFLWILCITNLSFPKSSFLSLFPTFRKLRFTPLSSKVFIYFISVTIGKQEQIVHDYYNQKMNWFDPQGYWRWILLPKVITWIGVQWLMYLYCALVNSLISKICAPLILMMKNIPLLIKILTT